MKRIALLTVLLLVVSLAAFAVDVKPTVAITGTASVTWGYDLDTNGTGFKNTADSSFRVSLLAEDGTDTHMGTGAMYGSITVSNVELFWNADSAAGAWTGGLLDGDLAAKIVITPFEIGVYPVPGLGADLLGGLESAAGSNIADRVVDANEILFAMPGSGFSIPYGTYIQAAFAPITVKVEVVSNDYWTANTSSEYAFGADLTVDLKPITIAAGAWLGSTATSFSAKLTLDNAPIVVWAGFEGSMPTGGTLTYGAGAGLTFTVVADTTLAASLWYGDTYTGIDAHIVFTEPGDAGLVPMLDTSITFNLLDVGGTLNSEWELVTATGYKVGLNSDNSNYARPFLNFTYGSNANELGLNLATAETVMYATAGVQLQVIPLTLLTAEWVSGSTKNNDLASTTVSLGSIQFIATVTY